MKDVVDVRQRTCVNTVLHHLKKVNSNLEDLNRYMMESGVNSLNDDSIKNTVSKITDLMKDVNELRLRLIGIKHDGED